MTFGIVVWIIGQMMINVGMVAGAAPGHRHPAAAGLLRRLGAGAVAGRPRHARRVRAPRAGGRPRARPAQAGPQQRRDGRPRRRSGPVARCSGPARRRWARPATPRRCSPRPTPCSASHPASRSPAWARASGSRPSSSPPPATRWSSCRSVPLPRRPNADLLRLPGRLRAAGARPLDVVDRIRPDVVVGFGGFVSVPAYLAARQRHVPLVVHEGNTLPGVANKLGARFTEHVATSFPDTPLPARDVRRAADPPDDLDPRPGGTPRRGARDASGCARTCPCCWSPAAPRAPRRINRAVLGAAPALADGRRPGAARRRALARGRGAGAPACRTSCSATSTGWTSPTPPPTRCCAASGSNTVTEVSGVGLPGGLRAAADRQR